MNTKAFVALLLIASMMNLGCYRDYRFQPSELKRLNGFRDQSRGIVKATSDLVQGKKKRRDPVMRDIKGRSYKFDEDTELIFWLCCGHPRKRLEDSYRAIDIKSDQFKGVTHDSARVNVALKQIQWVDVEEFDGTKTTLAVVGITVATMFVLLLVVSLTGAGSNGGGSDWDWD